MIASCLPKRDKGELPSPVQPLLTPSKTITGTYEVYALNNEREAINAAELEVYRPTLARTELGQILVPKLSFGVDKRADYVAWLACPYKQEASCLRGSTMLSEVYLGLVLADRYTVTIKACVNPSRSLVPEQNCGANYALTWHQQKAYSPQVEILVAELIEKQKEIYDLGESLYEVLIQFKKELTFCSKTGGQTPIDASDLVLLVQKEIEKQLENLLNLGPKFIAEHMGIVEPGDDDEELAAIMEPILVSDEDTYTPKGLSLANEGFSQRLEQYYSAKDVRLIKSFYIFPNINVEEFVKANSGIFSSADGRLVNHTMRSYTREEFNALSLRERAAAMGGAMLLGGGLSLSSNQQIESFAASQMIRSILWLQKPKSYECPAFNRVEKNLEVTRERLHKLRERILELKAHLQ